MTRTSRKFAAVGALVLGWLPSCAAGRYLRDRALDLTDVVDPKIGLGVGLGAKVEATDYVAGGVGFGDYETTEFFGRRTAHRWPGFLLVGPVGLDGAVRYPNEETQKIVLFAGLRARRPAPIQRWRIGAEAFLPGPLLGLYLNPGEIGDFLAGFAGFDPAGDDGAVKGAMLTIEDRKDDRDPLSTRPAGR